MFMQVAREAPSRGPTAPRTSNPDLRLNRAPSHLPGPGDHARPQGHAPVTQHDPRRGDPGRDAPPGAGQYIDCKGKDRHEAKDAALASSETDTTRRPALCIKSSAGGRSPRFLD
jgi:hypothetical protein